MITIYYSMIPNYVNPIEAVVNYTGLRSRCVMVGTNPYTNAAELAKSNPLSTVPAGIGDKGEALYGGPVLYEYLDQQHDKPKLFPVGPRLIFTRRQLWLAEGLFDQYARIIGEVNQPPEKRRLAFVERQWKKTLAALDQLERDALGWTGALDIAQIRAACSIRFVANNIPAHGTALGVFDTAYDWRATRPMLAAWYARASADPIFTPIQADR